MHATINKHFVRDISKPLFKLWARKPATDGSRPSNLLDFTFGG
jgi:hypothetical protein